MNAVLVPLDGSTLARRALPFALAIASRSQRPLILLKAVSTLNYPTETVARRVLHEAELELEEVAIVLTADGVQVQTRVADGEPATAILDAAMQDDVGLIVMSTHGRGGLGRWLYGSVADTVLRHAPAPVLIVPPDGRPDWPPDRPIRIVVPLDGTRLSEIALGPACEMADALQGSIYLVRSVPFTHYSSYGEGNVFMDEGALEGELGGARAYLEEVAERLRTPTRPVDVLATFGSPYLDVPAVAVEVGASLIAMATHGRAGPGRALLGSVTMATLRRTDVPLLLVRPPLVGQQHSTTSQANPEATNPSQTSTSEDAMEPTTTLSLTPAELELLIRAVGDRLHNQPADPRQTEPVQQVLTRLRTARGTRVVRREDAVGMPH